ncbi:hypothetical protein AALB51_04685 [Lachnospiraceae bacterium 62-26]|jgi:hypothetical protein|nr:hypothetical protein [Lachnospiraceae bacterium]GFI50895.1 hypothetical protein IMSAGC020_02105 [Lachnospiraceae bacterium]
MKTKYSIGFFAVMVIALTLVTGAYQLSYRQAKERLETKTAEETKPREPAVTVQEPTAVAADGQALKDGCYYLMEVNGYVVVYMSDKKTPYEYTDIKCDGLPSEMQEEIKNGKYMEDAKALYGFLENYSS